MRSRLITSLVVLCVSCAALADWPQFLGPNRDNVSAETNLAKSWPEGGPAVLWTKKLAMGFGPAAIAGGKVYVLDREGDDSDVLRVLDLTTGDEEWTFQYTSPGKIDHPGSRSTPAVDDKFVFIVGTHGEVHCLGKDSHKVVWSKNLLKDFGENRLPGWAVAQSPLLYKNMVIVAPQSKTAGVVALDKATGEVKWQSPAIGSMSYCSPLMAVIGGKDQIVMESFSGTYGVDAADGKLLWSYEDWKVKTAPCPSPTFIGNDQLFVTGGYGAKSAIITVKKSGDAFSATGEKVGSVGSHMANAVYYKDRIFINSDGAGLFCLDREGKTLFKSKEKFGKGNFMIADGMIYIINDGSGTMNLVEIGNDAFTVVSSVKLLASGETWAPVAISDGKLICRDQNEMKCLDIKKK